MDQTNSPKKKTTLVVIVLAIIVIVAIIWIGNSNNNPENSFVASGEEPVSASEIVKVSSSVSEYQNAELGFLVKYPSSWEKEEVGTGVNFVIPIDKSQVSTIAKLQSAINVTSGTCAFPLVTTVKDRETVKEGNNSFNMITMSNAIQNKTYFNRMYTLQGDGICYNFSFASIEQDPASKGLSGSQLTQAQNNNKAITSTADTDFTNMVKSFGYVVLPQGKDESQAK